MCIQNVLATLIEFSKSIEWLIILIAIILSSSTVTEFLSRKKEQKHNNVGVNMWLKEAVRVGAGLAYTKAGMSFNLLRGKN